MDVITSVLLIAITTALTAMYELVIPVLRELSYINKDDILLNNKTLTYITFFFFSMLLFVPLLPIVLVPSLAEKFRIGALNSLTGTKI